MNKIIKCHGNHKVKKNYSRGKGPSSFKMHDSEMVFAKLNLKSGNTFLDLGCGAGDYSLYAAKVLGANGKVYALDIWDNIIEGVKQQAEKKELKNIQANVADIYMPLELDSESFDVCLLATVLHADNVIEKSIGLFQEIKRVLKPEGRLTIIECKKEESFFGPPLKYRVSPKELVEALSKIGFKKIDYIDLGYNYMLVFDI